MLDEVSFLEKIEFSPSLSTQESVVDNSHKASADGAYGRVDEIVPDITCS